MHVISVQCVTLWSCSHILREMFHSYNFRVDSLFLCVVSGALLHSIDTYMILFLFYKHIFDIYIYFLFFRPTVPNILGVFVEGCCYHSSELFTALHSEISQAQIRSTKLFKADELTSGLT